jgi:hypothetical protein
VRTGFTIVGAALIVVVLWEAFESIVLPRRVSRRFRITRFFYRATWKPWSAVARSMRAGKPREALLSYFGPLSLLLLLIVWAAGLILGFAIVFWAPGLMVSGSEGPASFGSYLYMSGSSFFTLGFGDITPVGKAGRFLAVIESGVGLGFLALVIGYLPVIYQGFSRRESRISLLDARAGSPPTACELLRRHSSRMDKLDTLLSEWEYWAADLMESHLSYPTLCYYRSQHNNQSWLGAVTTILDTCALVIVGVEGAPVRQAELTFAIARHAIVDLSQIFNTAPCPPGDRLPPGELARLRRTLAAERVKLADDSVADRRLHELRMMYEPYVAALSRFLLMNLPPWILAGEALDNWQTSAWGKISQGIKGPTDLGEDGTHT